MFAIQFVPLGYQPLTTLTAAQKLTVPPGANFALIKAEAQAVRWRDDGVAPTTSVGMPMLATDNALEYSGTLTNLQFIAETTGAILNVSYYRIAG